MKVKKSTQDQARRVIGPRGQDVVSETRKNNYKIAKEKYEHQKTLKENKQPQRAN
jgi:hypothetical protein